jgi:hypothetical protein
MNSIQSDIIAAHKHCSNHRREIEASALCGCFYCMAEFEKDEITEWVDWPEDTPPDRELSAGMTALCPRCGIDAVIGSASGYPIEAAFLSSMHSHWF